MDAIGGFAVKLSHFKFARADGWAPRVVHEDGGREEGEAGDDELVALEKGESVRLHLATDAEGANVRGREPNGQSKHQVPVRINGPFSGRVKGGGAAVDEVPIVGGVVVVLVAEAKARIVGVVERARARRVVLNQIPSRHPVLVVDDRVAPVEGHTSRSEVGAR
eukprot:963622-Prymnesium_polylepis.3